MGHNRQVEDPERSEWDRQGRQECHELWDRRMNYLVQEVRLGQLKPPEEDYQQRACITNPAGSGLDLTASQGKLI